MKAFDLGVLFSPRLRLMAFIGAVGLLTACTGMRKDTVTVTVGRPGVLKSEFIFENAPVPSCHASTIVESDGVLLAAWFAGTDEGNKDVGIWVSRSSKGVWSPPVEVVNGVQTDGSRYPCWNPVLFQPAEGTLMLFYKVGASPSQWWGMLMTSTDRGLTWSKPQRLAEDILGPIKNKPVQVAGGDIVCPSSTENQGWRVHFERTRDGKSWERTEPVNDGKKFGAIQPAILVHRDGSLQALGRTRQGTIFQIWSSDQGRTWGEMAATDLPNPNSGIDAVTLRDGRHLLVYNHTTSGRTPLNVAISTDGKVWQAAAILESVAGEFSYPAVIQSRDDLVHITYTWKRQRVKHVIIDPSKLHLEPISPGR
jgi:predicted neuraminidase